MIENFRISFSKFISVIKLHEMNLSIRRISSEVNLSEEVVTKVIHMLHLKVHDYFGISLEETFTRITLIENGSQIIPIVNTLVLKRTDIVDVTFIRSKNHLSQYKYKLAYNFSNSEIGKISNLHRFVSFLEKEIANINVREIKLMNNCFLDILYRFNLLSSESAENGHFNLVADNRYA